RGDHAHGTADHDLRARGWRRHRGHDHLGVVRDRGAYLKWLTVVLFAYIVAGFLAKPDWGAALRETIVPQISLDREFVATLVGILGTTISPYLFFWQTSLEVEDERARGRGSIAARRGATPDELR